MKPENGITTTLYTLKFSIMENLKKLASKILEKPGIKHENLKPRKWEIKALKEYLPTVWFKLITTFIHEHGWALKLTDKIKDKLGSQSIKCKHIKYLQVAHERHEERQYKIIKL